MKKEELKRCRRMNNRPLVSIVVLTYNSSEYVLETLNSAYRQTYQGELELIITDDCSKDNTVEVCREWLQAHGSRFVRTELITVDENTGVSKNINRGCRAAQGEWIKPIAGDDILTDDCIEVMEGKADEFGPECTFIASPCMGFTEISQLQSKEKLDVWIDACVNITIDINYAFNNPLFIISGPCFLLSKKMLEEIGYYPEIFRNVEDAPLSRKVLSAGYAIHVIEQPVVFYRINNPKSVTATEFNNINSQRIHIECCEKYLLPHFTYAQRWDVFFKLLPLRINIAFNGKVKPLVSLAYVINRYFQISFYKKILN